MDMMRSDFASSRRKLYRQNPKTLVLFEHEYNIEIDKLALLYIRDLPEITSLVIGCEKKEQVMKNMELLKQNSLPSELIIDIKKHFNDISDEIINPSLWNR